MSGIKQYASFNINKCRLLILLTSLASSFKIFSQFLQNVLCLMCRLKNPRSHTFWFENWCNLFFSTQGHLADIPKIYDYHKQGCLYQNFKNHSPWEKSSMLAGLICLHELFEKENASQVLAIYFLIRKNLRTEACTCFLKFIFPGPRGSGFMMLKVTLIT